MNKIRKIVQSQHVNISEKQSIFMAKHTAYNVYFRKVVSSQISIFIFQLNRGDSKNIIYVLLRLYSNSQAI